MNKRLFSFLLCLVLCMSLLPMAVLAEETTEESTEPTIVETIEDASEESTGESAEPTTEETTEKSTEASSEETTEPTTEKTTEEASAETTAETEEALVEAVALDGAAPTALTQAMFNSAGSEATDSNPVYKQADGTYRLKYGGSGSAVSYSLSGNISISNTIVMTGLDTIELDLNGKTLTMTADKDIFSLSGGSLTLKDSGSGGKITFQSGKSGCGVVMNSISRFTMTGGTITGCTTGVYMDGSSTPIGDMALVFTMSGGTISNCTSKGSYQAGGVYVGQNRKFTMTGGTITNCKADKAGSYAAQDAAGGVYVAAGGTFDMSSGTISDCSAYANDGAGGVYAGGKFTMSANAKIESCSDNAWDSAGGVYVPSDGVFNMQNGTITKCTTTGERSAGGVRMGGGSTFTMTDGTISYCEAKGTETSDSNSNFRAGGVYMGGNAKFTMSGGKIDQCETSVNYSAGGVYVDTNSTFKMTGGTVTVCKVVFPGATDGGTTESIAAQNVAGGVYNNGTFTMQGTSASQKATVYFCYVQTPLNGNTLNQSSVLDDPRNGRQVAGNVVNTNKLTMGSAYSSITGGFVQCSNQAYGEAALDLDIYNTKDLTANDGTVGCLHQKSGATLTKSADAADTTTFSNGGVNCGTISAGKFTGGSLTNYGTISAGEFTGGSLTNYGTINDGAFNCWVKNGEYLDGSTWKGGVIRGGTFTGEIRNSKNEVSFNHSNADIICGGDFSMANRVADIPVEITFDLNGASGDAPAPQWRWNAKATKPADPERAGYRFCGWFEKEADGTLETTPWDFNLIISETTVEKSKYELYAKWEALLATAPAGQSGLTYNGNPQTLITAGTLSSYASGQGYTLEYKLSTGSTYSTTIPTATDAGDYTVQYRVRKGNDTADSGTIRVAIGRAAFTATASMTGYTYGTAAPTPGVSNNPGGGTVTYYYSANSDKSAANSWPGDTALEAGTYYLFAKIAQTKNYKPCETVAVPFTVAPARPQIGTALTASLYVNDTLQADDVQGGMTVAGSFAITGEKTWTTSGSKTTTVTFTPSDAKNYQSVEDISVAVTVSKRTVTSVTSTLSAVTDKDYGTAQSALGLPDKVNIRTADGKAFENIPVTWSGYNANTLSAQTLTGALDLSGIDNEVAQAETPVTASISVTLKALVATAPKYDPKTTAYTGEPIGHELGSIGGVQSVKYEYKGKDGTSYAKSETAPTNAGSYAVTARFTMEAGYAPLAAASSTLTITAKPVTPKLTIAAGTHTYDGSEHKPAVTLKDDDDTIPAGEYTVSYSDNVNAGTATVTITDRSGGNYSFTSVKGTNTFEIDARPVTLKSADATKEYDGTALTDADKLVTATGMVDGETFAYDFTGTQTDIGASDNAFTARDNGKAKVDNYAITCTYGTLRVTVPAGIGNGTEDMTVDTVTSDDRKTIEDTLKTVEDYLGMEPTKDEATELNELKDKLSDLLDRLDEAKNAAGDKDITKTDGITKDNAKPSDKKKLEDAKDAIEKALEDFGANLTEEEKQELSDKLDRINAALDAIAAAEAAAKAVKTGDEAMPILWLALSLSAALALGYTARRKKN